MADPGSFNSPNSRDTPDQLPGLARDLRAIARTGIETPAARDTSFRADVHRHFAGASTRRQRSPWISAAAVLVLLLAAVIAGRLLLPASSVLTPTPPSTPNADASAAAAGGADIDGNGRVDILDVLALAHRLESGVAIDEAGHARFDLNGDGSVDRRDVDVIAGRAVELDGRTG